MVVRHPHVFGNVAVNNSEEVLVNWDAIKKETKGQSSQSEVLKSVSKALPSLMRSAKVQHKAAKVGFDWPDVSGALNKVEEETKELKEAITSGTHLQCEEELGDLLFSVANVSRFIHVEPEQALSLSCDKFIMRFQKMEQFAKERGINMDTSTLDVLNLLWEEAKAN